MTIPRREIVNGAAWSVPVVAVAIATPAAAASTPVEEHTKLVQTHFSVQAENEPGRVRVKFGYQGDKQGAGYPDTLTRYSIFVTGSGDFGNDLVEYGGHVLVKNGPAAPVNTVVSVPTDRNCVIRYEVHLSDGWMALQTAEVFTPPKRWGK